MICILCFMKCQTVNISCFQARIKIFWLLLLLKFYSEKANLWRTYFIWKKFYRIIFGVFTQKLLHYYITS